MKRSTYVLSLLLVVVLPTLISAQSDASERFRARHGHDCCRNYTEFKEYCEEFQGGRASPNPPVCSAAGTSTTQPTSRLSFKGSPVRLIAMSTIFGGFVGAIGGSLAKNANGVEQWQAGFEIGAGSFMVMSMLANRNWSRLASATVGAIAGAALGAGAGTIADGQIVKGSAGDTAESKVPTYAAYGAAALAFTGFVFPKSGLSRIPPFRAMMRPDSRMKMVLSGDRLGMRILW